MQNQVTATARSTAADHAQVIAALRTQLTALTFGSAYLSATEQLQANHHAHECENAGQLARWLANTRAELDRRAARSLSPTTDVLKAPFSHQRGRRCLGSSAPQWPSGGTIALDTVADFRDRRAAAAFQPAATLTVAALTALLTPQSNA